MTLFFVRPFRLQATVHSGKAILHVRNALETPIVLSKAILVKPDDEKKAAPMLPAPVPLAPGEIRALDVTHPVIELLKPLPIASAITKRVKLKLFFDAPTSELSYEADCTVRVDGGRLVEFGCWRG